MGVIKSICYYGLRTITNVISVLVVIAVYLKIETMINLK